MNRSHCWLLHRLSRHSSARATTFSPRVPPAALPPLPPPRPLLGRSSAATPPPPPEPPGGTTSRELRPPLLPLPFPLLIPPAALPRVLLPPTRNSPSDEGDDNDGEDDENSADCRCGSRLPVPVVLVPPDFPGVWEAAYWSNSNWEFDFFSTAAGAVPRAEAAGASSARCQQGNAKERDKEKAASRQSLPEVVGRFGRQQRARYANFYPWNGRQHWPAC